MNAEKANFRTTMDKDIENLNKESAKRHKDLEEGHIADVTALKKKIDALEANLLQVKLKNKTDENKLREEYKILMELMNKKHKEWFQKMNGFMNTSKMREIEEQDKQE